MHYSLDCKREDKKEQTFITVTSFKMVMNPEQIHLDFENLIPGNEQLTNEVSKTINENSHEIFKDVKGAIEQVFEKIFTATTNRVFSKLKESDIFLD